MRKKTVHYHLSGKTNRLNITIIDVLGKPWKITRSGHIRKPYFSDNDYYVAHVDFESIKHYAFEEGIYVDNDTCVRVAVVTLDSEEEISVTKDLMFNYWFFKPKVRHSNEVKCEEMTK